MWSEMLFAPLAVSRSWHSSQSGIYQTFPGLGPKVGVSLFLYNKIRTVPYDLANPYASESTDSADERWMLR